MNSNINAQRELVEKYSTLRKRKETLEGELSQINGELVGTPDKPGGITAELAKYMQDENLKTIKFEDLGAVTLMAPTPRSKYEKENEPTVFDFLMANGGALLIKPTVHPSSFSSFIKEMLEKGQAIPECIEVFYQPSLRFTKP